MLTFSIDEKTLKQLALSLPEVKDLFIEPGRCITIKIEVDGKNAKIKIAPFVTTGKLELRIFKVFAEGININVASLVPLFLGKMKKTLSLELRRIIDIEGNSIFVFVPVKFVGIDKTGLILRF